MDIGDNSQLSPDTGGGTGGTGNWKLTTHNFQTIDLRLEEEMQDTIYRWGDRWN